METTAQIGHLIQQRRKALQLTQLDLGELSNLSLRTIKALESGDANLGLRQLLAVLDALGLRLTFSERVTP